MIGIVGLLFRSPAQVVTADCVTDCLSLIQNIIYTSSSLEPVTTNYPSRRVDGKMFH